MKQSRLALAAIVVFGLLQVPEAVGQTAKKEKDGKWESADGSPT